MMAGRFGLALTTGLLVAASPVVAQEQDGGDNDAAEAVVVEPVEPIAKGDTIVLPEGFRLALITTEEVSSKRVRKGDLIQLRVRDDVLFDGQVIIPAGVTGVGEITRAEKKGMMGRGGKLSARMLYLEMEDRPVRIVGELSSVGDNQTALATAALGATLGFVFFVTGKTAAIPEGTELIVELDRETRLTNAFRTASQGG